MFGNHGGASERERICTEGNKIMLEITLLRGVDWPLALEINLQGGSPLSLLAGADMNSMFWPFQIVPLIHMTIIMEEKYLPLLGELENNAYCQGHILVQQVAPDWNFAW